MWEISGRTDLDKATEESNIKGEGRRENKKFSSTASNMWRIATFFSCQLKAKMDRTYTVKVEVLHDNCSGNC